MDFEDYQIEDVARAICHADGVDPDKETVGLGNRVPLSEKCPL